MRAIILALLLLGCARALPPPAPFVCPVDAECASYQGLTPGAQRMSDAFDRGRLDWADVRACMTLSGVPEEELLSDWLLDLGQAASHEAVAECAL